MILGVKQELMLDLQNLKVKCQAYDKFEATEKKRSDAKHAEQKRMALEQSAQLQATQFNSEHDK